MNTGPLSSNRVASVKLHNKKKGAASGPIIGSTVCHNYVLKEKIGEGSFGKVYLAMHKENQNEYAVKIEPRTNQEHRQPKNTLLNESRVLCDLKGEDGFPRMYYFIKDSTRATMVMSLLGKNLEDLLDLCQRRFSKRTLYFLAIEMISRIQQLHKHGYIHKDLKPENFLIGRDGQENMLYLIDFGFTQKIIDEKGEHLAYAERCGQIGTARYTSVSSHLGIQQSRRDDLESIGYILVYLGKGSLPWNNLKAQTKEEKNKLISQMKASYCTSKLCDGLPKEFLKYTDYVKRLNFSETPDYNYLLKLFKDGEKALESKDVSLSWMPHVEKLQVNNLIKPCELDDKFLLEDLKEPDGSNLEKLTKDMNFKAKKLSEISSLPINFSCLGKIIKQATSTYGSGTIEINDLTNKTTTFTKNLAPMSSLSENFLFEASQKDLLKENGLQSFEGSFEDLSQEDCQEEESSVDKLMKKLNTTHFCSKFKV